MDQSSFGSVRSSLMLGTTPPRFCSSEGMMILVALPLATFASASRPVSYTHLDVYKRQLGGSAGGAAADKDREKQGKVIKT